MRARAFTVTGPFCGTCLAELLERVRVIRGVSGVAAGLPGDGTAVMVLNGPSPVDEEQVRSAVEQAGFSLNSPSAQGRSTRRRARALLADLAAPRKGSRPRR